MEKQRNASHEQGRLARRSFASPIGKLAIAADSRLVRGIRLNAPSWNHLGPPEAEELCRRTREEIEAYLTGELQEFTVAFEPRGTPFHRDVWAAMYEIPYGKTRTYGELARRVGQPDASRAVGVACGANPIPLIIPCHRVLAAGGAIGGFGGGVDMKRWLLDLEQGQFLLPCLTFS